MRRLKAALSVQKRTFTLHPMSPFNRFNLLKAVSLSFIMTSLIFLMHISKHLHSMVRLNHTASKGLIANDYIPLAISYHKTLFDFAKRPLTTALIEKSASAFSITEPDAFVLINFTFLFFNGILLYILSVRHFCHAKQALFNILFFYLSYSVLFSFFSPVYSYDEPLQYFFIFGTIICFFEKWTVAFVFTAICAMIARETSVFILLGLLIVRFRMERFRLQGLVIFALPVIVYMGFLTAYVQAHHLLEAMKSANRERGTALQYNFSDKAHTIESIFALVNTSLLPLFFLVRLRRHNGLLKTHRYLAESVMVVFLINTVICLLFTQAREARLFNLPFMLFYPLAFHVIGEMRPLFRLERIKALLKQWPVRLGMTCIVGICYFISFRVFCIVDENATSNLFNEYTFVLTLGVAWTMLFFYFQGKERDWYLEI